MHNWKKYKLGEIIDFKNGKNISFRNERGNFPIYGGNGIVGYSDKYNSENETIIVGRVGAYCGNIYYSNKNCWITDNAILGKVKDNNNCTRYFFYFLGQLGLNNFRGGSSQPLLNQGTLNRIDIEIPDSKTQTRIASILSSLDDKIELNRRMNQTLEQMAQALFNHYFVDNIDPDNLPEGWRWGKLEELIYIKHGYAFKGEFFTEDPNPNILLTPGNFKIGGGFNYKKFKYYKGDIPLDYVLNKNDLIVTMTDLSKDGDTLGYSSLVPEIPNKRLLHNQRIGKVVFKGNENLKFYLNWVLRSDSYRSFVLGGATGTTVKHTSPSRICEYRCIIPTDKVIDLFIKQVEAFSKMIGANEIQCDTLSNVRDTLLPKLMSGEIDVDKK